MLGMRPPVLELAKVLVLALLVAGCAALPAGERTVPPRDAHELARCEQLYAAADAAVAGAGVGDAQDARVEGFRYLRVNRTLAAIARDDLHDEAFHSWVESLAALDRTARAYELANLGPQASERFPLKELRACATKLREADLADPATRQLMRSRARVPDDYELWQRVVGVYPLTMLPFSAGVSAWQRRTTKIFAQPFEHLPVAGRRVRYEPANMARVDAADAQPPFQGAHDDPLGMPLPHAATLQRLLVAYAPAFEVDEMDEHDRIGAPTWGQGGRIEVDTARPTVFSRVAHTRYRGTTLLQLVYAVWFPSRPREPGIDLLGGHLDGLIWRVTLSRDGLPLVYDTIHNCGCYHLFFPTARAELLAQPATLEEVAFAPQRLPAVAPGEQLTVHIAARTHYIRRITIESPATGERRGYVMAADDELRSLPRPEGGRRSLFGPDGIVAGTSRGERFFFWPMGVRDPGAMRQWGRHATAFVGRRHFDDADLVERYFVFP